MSNNILYAQSGGPTPVINATACGVIQQAAKEAGVGRVFAGINGISGILQESIIDTSAESPETIEALKHTPGAAFGSCRYKLPDPSVDIRPYERFFEICKTHDIGSFLYNGGGDSHDTANKIAIASQMLNFPLNCLGLPKTIDNDLDVTDNSPGFASAAKYIAISTQEAAQDLASMCATSTKVFVFEVMGRHAGWIAASAALGKETEGCAPHIILLPEVAFAPEKFLAKVKNCVEEYGYCFVVASEGLRNTDGRFVSEQGTADAFGHEQLGGLAPKLANLIKQAHGYKYHWSTSDYLQRAATHIASAVDLEQAYAVGCKGVELASQNVTQKALIIKRVSNTPYQWTVGTTAIGNLANIEVKLPANYISSDGMGVTEACLDYMRPLIQGEAYPTYKNGLPVFAKLKRVMLEKQLAAFVKSDSTTA